MKALFVHQNCPGQFKHLAPALASREGNQVVFISQKGRPTPKGVVKVEYEPHREVTKGIHPYLHSTESAVLNGQAVARSAFALKNGGFTPDIMIGNPGWGETLFLKDVFPDAPLLSYSEFYYRGSGSDVGFDPEFKATPDSVLRARSRAMPHLMAIEAADYALSPTEWQKRQFPKAYRQKITVIHDGIDSSIVAPDPDAAVVLEDGTSLSTADEVLTYVSRNLEPYRGFHTFMRALPKILVERPQAHIIVVGGNEVSYGARAPDGKSWREVYEAETGPLPARVHFTGRVPYPQFLRILQVSSLHIYLTYPFVLSWSMLEAMSAGAVVLGSDTPPVTEVIEDGKNGYVTDFFDHDALAQRSISLLAARNDQRSVREAARQTVLSGYDLASCLPAQLSLISQVIEDYRRISS